jgi:23S rRNA (pseudouridine1915-N3)-methyltransferase
MRVRLLCVGRPRDRLLARLHDRYAERLLRLGARYESAWVPEVEAGSLGAGERARRREADALLAQVGERSKLVVLDPRGLAWSSEQLARRIETWATPGLTLALGGPEGLHDRVRERADELWSLSPLTLTHEMARALVVEQLYRALSIRRGLAYHR